MKSENTYRVPPTSKARIALRVFLNLSATVICLLTTLWVFPQLGGIKNYVNAIWVILILAALNILIWPLLIRSFLGLFQKIYPVFMLIAFPIISLILPAITLEIASWLSLGLVINGFSSALLIALLMAVISSVFASLFVPDDEPLLYQWILKRTSTKLMGIIYLTRIHICAIITIVMMNLNLFCPLSHERFPLISCATSGGIPSLLSLPLSYLLGVSYS